MTRFLLALCFFLYPFDSLPFFNVGVYRPIWLLPASISVLFFVRRYVDKHLIFYFLFLLYGYVLSLITVGFDFATLAIILLSFLSVYAFFYFFKNEAALFGVECFYNYKLPRYVMVGSLAPTAIGAMYIVSPSLGEVIEAMFSHRDYLTRMQLVSGEPSWAAKYIIIWMAASYYLFKSKALIVFSNSLFVVFILFTGSSLGMILAFIFFLYKYRRNALSILLMVFSALVLALLVSRLGLLGDYASNRVSNLYSMAAAPLEYISQTSDRSLLIRVVSPMVGFFMFVQSLGLGFGIESSEVVYGEVLRQVFSFFSISMDYEYFMSGGVSTKNIYLKIIGEFGAVGLVGIIWILSKAWFMKAGFGKDFVVVSLLLGLNSDGYAYFPFLVSLALLFSSSTYNRGIIKRR
ncbi:hypothetical protein [Halomonas maura]|uniref:hypothetical protein n=1 Tax=Halomonas maura TaxID=117606 RepID=UPI0025B3434B|nr:hypothetical protein [Halomonas maura]MDN3554938.1 hypothetical protein [Halomonas maura]